MLSDGAMFGAAWISSIAVAVVFAVILMIMWPVTRQRPKTREDLWIAKYMLVLALCSIGMLIVVVMLWLPMVYYFIVMVFVVIGFGRLRWRQRN